MSAKKSRGDDETLENSTLLQDEKKNYAWYKCKEYNHKRYIAGKILLIALAQFDLLY